MSPQITGAWLVGLDEGKGCDPWAPAGGPTPPPPPCGQARSPPEGPCGRVGYGVHLGTLEMLGSALVCLFRTGQLDVTIPGK